MFTKTKIALAATLLLGTASLASAQDFDPNPANRYPAYNEPQAAVPYGSAPVFEGRNVGRVRTPAPVNRGIVDYPNTSNATYSGGAGN